MVKQSIKVRQAVRGWVNKAGWDLHKLQRHPPEFNRLKYILDSRGINTVLDVGANVGQFAENLFCAGYQGEIISFEPMPNEHEILKLKALNHERWKIGPPVALSKDSGTAEFHVAGNSISSSLLPMEDTHLEAAPQSAEAKRITVPLERLDNIIHEVAPSGDMLLKLDVQGAELDVLKGAEYSLDRIAGIKTEMSFVSLYTGQPLFQDVYDYVTERGYHIADITRGFGKIARAKLFQCDGLFIRS